MPLFDKILIANRGEIACRIMRTARKLGINTVAVFSEADANAKHLEFADEAYCVGPAPSAESYLRQDKIIEVCKKTGAQAVHPGYGFLSETASFSDNCASEGITFIGPPKQALLDMGSKSASKDIMTAANVPCTPGYHGDNQDLEHLQKQADEHVKYPLIVKAVMGGGGKGMRIVENSGELKDGVLACQREALKSFADDRVLIEKYLRKPRHIEFQVFADTHGNVVHLFERDCSVQRRHQKVLEEAPAPGMSEELRNRMGEAAVAAARAVNYVGAGTVEFMLDEEDESFYFMEMNTRLQVEHPVSEMITDVDLVEWQLRVASGEKLPFTQEEINARLRGHAIEARIYAENPDNNFLPGSGHVSFLSTPSDASEFTITPNESGIRIDSGIRQGDDVSIFYDPMIAKLIVHGRNREVALRRLSLALRDFKAAGLPTNIEFLRKCVSHDAFQEGGVDTSFIEKHMTDLLDPKELHVANDNALILASMYTVLSEQREQQEALATSSTQNASPWSAHTSELHGVRLTEPYKRVLDFNDEQDDSDNSARKVEITYNADMVPGSGLFQLRLSDSGEVFDITESSLDGSELICKVNGIKLTGTVGQYASGKSGTFKDSLAIFAHNTTSLSDDDTPTRHVYGLRAVQARVGGGSGSGADGSSISAPMPGTVVKMLVNEGDAITKGTQVCIMEAMKMEHIIRAPIDGTVDSVFHKEGSFVSDGAPIMTFIPAGENEESAESTG